MKLTRLWIAFLVIAGLSPEGLAYSERWLQGQVLENHGATTKPAGGAQVWIVNVGNPYTTQTDGGYRVLVPDAIRLDQTIVLFVKRRGWAIETPRGGELSLPPSLRANIVLSPEASPEFMSALQLAKLIESLPEKMKAQVKPDGKAGDMDPTQVVRDYATEHRLPEGDVIAKVEQLIAQYEQSEDIDKRCRAAIYHKNLDQAATICRAGASAKTDLLKRKRQEVESLSKSLQQSEVPMERHPVLALGWNIRRPNPRAQFLPMAHDLQEPSLTIWLNSAQLVAESQSLKPGAAQLEEARRQLIKLTEEVVGEFRATGDTYYANYQFEEALAAYKEGFGYVDKKDLPTLWATMQWVMGLANREIGIRTKDAAIREHLAEAVKAFGEALTIFKKSDFPEAWAAIENNLGIVLGNQGTRTSGEAGTRLLAEAVAAYRAALTVRTKDQLPQDWAMTQNNLGKALLHLEDWRGAAEAYRNVLTLYPDYDEGYSSANALYHEKLFSYPEAFALSQQWLERHPDDLSAQANFAEAHFTTGRFADAEKRLTALLTNLRLDLSTGLGLRTLHVATLVALNKPESVPAALTTLRDFVAKVPADSEAGWSFEGSKHFIGSEPKLAPSRAWLLDLFSAVEEKDAQKRLAALEKVQADFPSMK